MRTFTPSLAALTIVLCACTAEKPTPKTVEVQPAQTIDQAVVDAQPPDAAPVSTGRPSTSVDTVSIAQLALRKVDFDRQQTVVLPDGFFPSARRLIPANAHLVAFALERNMFKTKPSPGRRLAMVRWVSQKQGTQLRKDLAAHLTQLGWTVKDQALHAPLQDPVRGRLSIKITEENELATRVELTLAGVEPSNAPPLEAAHKLLSYPLEWLDDADIERIGYEIGHFHAIRFQGAVTDAQRLALAVRASDPIAREALSLRLADRLEKSGFQLKAKATGLWKKEGESFTTRTSDDPRVLVLHYQRHWRR